MTKILCSLGLLLGVISAAMVASFPEAEISNGIIQARLYLPDAEKGYYQGTRFDWSGVMPSLTYNAHSYFGQWFEKYDPKLHDAISGPVEEFTPLGFDDAKPGELFVKVGVGALRKADDAKYRFATPYETVDLGKWSTKTKPSSATFTHELSETVGYAYQYTKTVSLTKGKPELVLEHRLKNTGKKAIETSVYDHNFYMIDNQPTGPDMTVTFPFTLQTKGANRGLGTALELKDNQLMYTRELNKGESTHCYLTGFSDSAQDYDIRIENHKTGAGVRIRSDHPISELAYWSIRTTLCPEPYIKLKVEPGKEVTWKIFYEYYALPATAANR